jgi:UDP-N-acetylmuramoyl-tripeptide--D-alanyl-D-alanine ligase
VRKTYASPASFNNHLGVPLSILGAPLDSEVIVLEMGTNQPGDIAPLTRLAWPSVALITAIGPSHLAGLGSIEGVAAAKAEIFDGLTHDGLVVLSTMDRWSAQLASQQSAVGRRVVRFGRDGDLALTCAPTVHASGTTEGLAFTTTDGVSWWLPSKARVVVECSLAAIVIARALGLDDDAIRRGLAHFKQPVMRQQRRRLHGDVLLVDDSYNANPLSVTAALQQLAEDGVGRRRIAVLGEMRELGTEHERLHAEVGRCAAGCANQLWVIGDDAHAMADAARNAGCVVMPFGLASEAASAIAEHVKDGDVILVKGSRAMALEAICDALRQQRPEAAA